MRPLASSGAPTTDFIAVVTGGASGIGRAIALDLATRQDVSALAILDIDEQAAAATVEELRGYGTTIVSEVIDLADASSLDTTLRDLDQRLGGVNLLFNVAGVVGGRPNWPQMSVEKIERVVAVKLIATIISTQFALQVMPDRGGGSVLNIGSSGAFSTRPREAAYSAANAGVVQFSKSCAELYPTTGVRVNSFSPGVTDTPMLDYARQSDWVAKLLEEVEPLRPEAVASAAVQLAFDANANGHAVLMLGQPASATVVTGAT